MSLGGLLARAFGMSDEVWSRHANPWSVWTRFTILPLLAAAVWSREWIGWWATAPCAVLCFWAWLNPRVFPKPRSTAAWASRAVLGERVWLNRRTVAIRREHTVMPHLLGALAASGLPFLVWGLITLAPWPTLFGLSLTILGKLWFLDRMVWLWEEMKDTAPTFGRWQS